MTKITLLTHLLFLNVFLIFDAYGKTIEVSSQEEFKQAQISAVAKDVILWLPGTYKDIYLNIFKDNITVQAKELGKTIFTGASKAYIGGDRVTFKGFQYIDGNAGKSDIIIFAGDYIRVEELTMLRYAGHKYVHMKNKSQHNVLYKCNFETRTNNVNKNIISIGVNGEQPNFHKIQYCSFKNFEGTGGDMGVEPIRIGSSTQALFDSKTIVEYCYFTQCNGDSELISNKSGKNIIRYNTFEDNPKGEVVLRHGNESYVYGNFFIRGKGGVRIREGNNHYIFNNYFTELTMRSITLNSGEQNPIKNVYFMHNTFVNTAKLHLGGNKAVLPKKIVLENNLFAFPTMKVNIGNATGKESWLGNMCQGNLGVPATKGLKKIVPLLKENEYGFFELEKRSPVVNSAIKSKIKLPVFEGLDADTKLALDIVKNKRPIEPTLKDVGCLELTAAPVAFKPFATSENTGPSYKTGLMKKPLETKEINKELLVVDEVSLEKAATEKPKKELTEVEKLQKQVKELQAKVNKAEKQE